jgi:uncharacterized membrane protein (GlpM family)
MPLLLKGLVSAVIIVALSELARRHAVLSGLLAAMPLTTLLVILWVYVDTRDVATIAQFSRSVLWALIPTALFFAALVVALKKGLSFWPALGFSMVLWMAGAVIHLWLLSG